jgi:hypothetical protein
MEKQIELQGCHGTSISRSLLIQLNGFKKAEGRLGTGVYFWRDGFHAKNLAYGWWSYQLSEKCFVTDKNSNACIIWVKIGIGEEEFLDITSPEINEGFAQLCSKLQLKYDASKKQLAKAMTMFIDNLEKELNCKFKIVESMVAPPPKGFVPDYPIKALGAPRCYIVYDETCITISKVDVCS